MANVSSSNSQKALVPKLRFPGFEGEWKESTLGEIGTFTKGAPLSKADISSQGTPFILYGELYTTYDEVIENVVRRTEKSASSEQISRIGDVIIPTSGETPEEIATASCVMLPGVILAGDLNIFRTNTVDGRLISYIIRHVINKKISCVAQGKSVVHVKADELSKISVRYPGSAEQHKLLSFLALLQSRIAVQRRLVEALKSYKRGLSNALFERVIEFCSGSDNKWTQFPLGDLGEFYNGLTGKQKTDFEHGSEPYIPYVNVYKNMVADTSACESVSVSEREHQNKVRYGDILFTQSSETLEEVGLSSVWLGDFEPFLNSFCFGIHFHENLCIFPLYVAHYFRSTDARLKIMHEGQGITRVNLSAERIKAISIPLPPMEVQKKIGMFLKSLNDKINEKQEIICQMEHLKIGLLQQLFI